MLVSNVGTFAAGWRNSQIKGRNLRGRLGAITRSLFESGPVLRDGPRSIIKPPDEEMELLRLRSQARRSGSASGLPFRHTGIEARPQSAALRSPRAAVPPRSDHRLLDGRWGRKCSSPGVVFYYPAAPLVSVCCRLRTTLPVDPSCKVGME
jgi:hypothetical protein